MAFEEKKRKIWDNLQMELNTPRINYIENNFPMESDQCPTLLCICIAMHTLCVSITTYILDFSVKYHHFKKVIF